MVASLQKGIDRVAYDMNPWHPQFLSSAGAGSVPMMLQSRLLSKSGAAFVIGGGRIALLSKLD
jgi:hypothetical protein